jgi:carbonic anhydrase
MAERIHIVQASGQQVYAVQSLWREYWDSLGLPAEFQNFAEESKKLPGAYTPPKGRLLLALCEGEAAATGAFRPLSLASCEAKRLYVRPRFRGQGIGLALLKQLVREARAAGHREMYGDTLPSMREALQMYKRFGFSVVPPYSENPTPGAIFLKLPL